MKLEEVFPGLAQMSREEVLRIFHEFQNYVENMEQESFVESPELLVELERRAARARSHPEELVTWEEFKKELESEDE